ncbi:MAG TPA: helix-turn-helix domain-containing protein, partial [Flavisolibacter sp.]|nr:helix-turn-helix domain-containing protein [Flavisolibacter sp.]
MQKETSERLKHYRRISGMSQEALAEASGISIRTIQRIEKGLSTGSAYTISTLAKTLNIDTVDLLPAELQVTGAGIPEAPLATNSYDLQPLKLLNLGALSIVVLPLSNILVPAMIFRKHRHNEAVNTYGRRILSFQVLWTLATLVLM